MNILNRLFYGKPRTPTALNEEQLEAEIRDMGGRAELRHTIINSCMYGSVETTDVWPNVPQEEILDIVQKYAPNGGMMRLHTKRGRTHSIFINARLSEGLLELNMTNAIFFPSSKDADALIIKRSRYPVIARTTEFLKRIADGMYAEVRYHPGKIPKANNVFH